MINVHEIGLNTNTKLFYNKLNKIHNLKVLNEYKGLGENLGRI